MKFIRIRIFPQFFAKKYQSGGIQTAPPNWYLFAFMLSFSPCNHDQLNFIDTLNNHILVEMSSPSASVIAVAEQNRNKLKSSFDSMPATAQHFYLAVEGGNDRTATFVGNSKEDAVAFFATKGYTAASGKHAFIDEYHVNTARACMVDVVPLCKESEGPRLVTRYNYAGMLAPNDGEVGFHIASQEGRDGQWYQRWLQLVTVPWGSTENGSYCISKVVDDALTSGRGRSKPPSRRGGGHRPGLFGMPKAAAGVVWDWLTVMVPTAAYLAIPLLSLDMGLLPLIAYILASSTLLPAPLRRGNAVTVLYDALSQRYLRFILAQRSPAASTSDGASGGKKRGKKRKRSDSSTAAASTCDVACSGPKWSDSHGSGCDRGYHVANIARRSKMLPDFIHYYMPFPHCRTSASSSAATQPARARGFIRCRLDTSLRAIRCTLLIPGHGPSVFCKPSAVKQLKVCYLS